MSGFIATHEHRRFVKFASTLRRKRTIGLCFVQTGVSKTWSACRYAHWHRIELCIPNKPRNPRRIQFEGDETVFRMRQLAESYHERFWNVVFEGWLQLTTLGC